MLYPHEDENISHAKDASLYFEFESIDGMAEILKRQARIIDLAEETANGRKEVVFEDLNGFMVTFSCDAEKNRKQVH